MAQFGRPSGIFVDRNDVLYVTDHQSDEKVNPGFKRGIYIVFGVETNTQNLRKYALERGTAAQRQ